MQTAQIINESNTQTVEIQVRTGQAPRQRVVRTGYIQPGGKARALLRENEHLYVRTHEIKRGRIEHSRWRLARPGTTTTRVRKRKPAKKKPRRKPAKRKTRKTAKKRRTRKNPRVPKKEKPPREWFYYKEALTRKRGAADPGAVVGSIWWKLADATKARIIRNKNKARARGKAVVVTSRGTITKRQVVKDIGRAAADRLYKKLKPSKREIAAAKKALK